MVAPRRAGRDPLQSAHQGCVVVMTADRIELVQRMHIRKQLPKALRRKNEINTMPDTFASLVSDSVVGALESIDRLQVAVTQGLMEHTTVTIFIGTWGDLSYEGAWGIADSSIRIDEHKVNWPSVERLTKLSPEEGPIQHPGSGVGGVHDRNINIEEGSSD